MIAMRHGGSYAPRRPWRLNWANPLTDGLVGFWVPDPFNDAIDLSRYDRGITSGPSASSFVKVGTFGGMWAWDFAGASTEYLRFGTDIIGAATPPSQTFFAWALANTNHVGIIIQSGTTGFDAGLLTHTNGSGRYFFDMNAFTDNAFSDNTTTSYTQPLCIHGVYNAAASTVTLYINGVAQADTGTTAANLTSNEITIGGRVGGSLPFNGKVWMAAHWDRALSPAECYSMYRASSRWNIFQAPMRRLSFASGGGAAPAAGPSFLPLLGVGS